MKDKKYQVFVSSTYVDLKEERQAAVEAILSSGNIPAGMELFTAGDESQMTVIKRWIDESDIYLLILGGRYGSIEPITGKSYTHLEYLYALEKEKPVFAAVITEKALKKKVRKSDFDVIEMKYPQLLKEFRAEVVSRMVRFWDDAKDIKLTIHETISEFSYSKEMVGWIKGDNSVNSSLLAEQIAELTRENSKLREELNLKANQNEPLYNNLTFEELKSLLEREKFKYDGIDTNLFNFLIIYGNIILGDNVYKEEMYKIFKQLLKYRIVTHRRSSYGFQTSFTEPGHNFYLKALIIQDKNVLGVKKIADKNGNDEEELL